MAIRISAKAFIVRNEHILLNKCRNRNGHLYYAFPGGGQNAGETLEAAVLREVLEETGFTVRFERLAAIYEEICTDPALVAKYPDYFHKLYLFCLCSMTDVPRVTPMELDQSQESSVWLPLDGITKQPLFPQNIRAQLPTLLTAQTPIHLGSIQS